MGVWLDNSQYEKKQLPFHAGMFKQNLIGMNELCMSNENLVHFKHIANHTQRISHTLSCLFTRLIDLHMCNLFYDKVSSCMQIKSRSI